MQCPTYQKLKTNQKLLTHFRTLLLLLLFLYIYIFSETTIQLSTCHGEFLPFPSNYDGKREMIFWLENITTYHFRTRRRPPHVITSIGKNKIQNDVFIQLQTFLTATQFNGGPTFYCFDVQHFRVEYRVCGVECRAGVRNTAPKKPHQLSYQRCS